MCSSGKDLRTILPVGGFTPGNSYPLLPLSKFMDEFEGSAAQQHATHVCEAPVTQSRGRAQSPQPAPQPPPTRQPPQQQAPLQQASGRGLGVVVASTQCHADGDENEACRPSAQPAASRPHKQALVHSSPASKAPAGTVAGGAVQPAPLQRQQSGPNRGTRQEGDGGAVRAAGLPQKRAHVEVESDKSRMAQEKSAREERRAHKGGKDAPQTYKERRPAADPQGSAPHAATDAAPNAAHGGSAGDRPATAEAFDHG